MSQNRQFAQGSIPGGSIPGGSVSECTNHIQCDVTNCVYHTADNACEAETVHVKPCTANSCCTSEKDTACETFLEK